jgi:hypothetical protein
MVWITRLGWLVSVSANLENIHISIYDFDGGNVYNLFNTDRHLFSAETYRYFRLRSFASWKNAAAV